MAEAKYDVLGIGNAIFDVLVQTDEGFLATHGMTKGGMALIDEARALSIYRDMGPATEMSGGSAANTIVGIASLGARAAYVGKVRDDQIGRLYSHDIRAAGVAFETAPAVGGPAVSETAAQPPRHASTPVTSIPIRSHSRALQLAFPLISGEATSPPVTEQLRFCRCPTVKPACSKTVCRAPTPARSWSGARHRTRCPTWSRSWS